MTEARLEMFRATYEAARERGDTGVERAMRAELARLGVDVGLETAPPEARETAAVEQPERAVPPKPRKRRVSQPKPDKAA